MVDILGEVGGGEVQKKRRPGWVVVVACAIAALAGVLVSKPPAAGPDPLLRNLGSPNTAACLHR